jgi:hypothetical protein
MFRSENMNFQGVDLFIFDEMFSLKFILSIPIESKKFNFIVTRQCRCIIKVEEVE